MKKINILHLLGLTPVAALPVIAIASCTTTTTTPDEVKPNIDLEVSKFDKPFAAKPDISSMTTFDAVESINKSQTEAEKLSALGKLITLPEMIDTFTYEVGFAQMDPSDKNSFIVPLTITEKATPTNTKTVQVKITGLTISTPLEDEVAKFQTSIPANATAKTEEASIVAKKINEAQDKEKYLATLVDKLPTLSEGFDFTVGIASEDKVETTSLNVLINVSKFAGSITKTTTLRITGFAVPILLDDEAAKFTTSLPANAASKTKETPIAIKEINEAADKKAKLASLVDNLPALSKGFSFVVGTASQDPADATVVNVQIIVTKDSDQTTKTTTLKITGFKESTALLEDEVKKFASPFTTTWRTDAASAIKLINGETDNQTKINLLREHVINFPTLLSPFSLTVGEAKAVANQETSITVSLKITQISNKNSKDATLTIMGFKDLATLLSEETAKYTTSLRTENTTVEASNEVERIKGLSSNDLKIAHLEAYVTSFPTLSPGFKLTVGEVAVGTINTTMTVKLTLTQENGGATKEATLIIVGFKTPPKAVDVEAAKFDTPTTAKDPQVETVNAVSQLNAITDNSAKIAELTKLATKIPELKEGFTYTIGAATIGKIATTMNVPITVIQTNGGETKSTTFVVTGFKVSLAALESEATKFNKSFAAKVTTTPTDTAINSINTPTEQDAKFTALSGLATDFPTKTGTFTYAIGRAVLSKTVSSEIEVPITITQTDNQASKMVTVKITGLAESAQSELIRIAKANLVNKPVLDAKKGENALAAVSKIFSDSELDKYYARVNLGTGFAYKLDAIRGTGNTIVITVNVTSSKPNTRPYRHSFIITNFASTLAADAAKYNVSLPVKDKRQTTNQVIRHIRDRMDLAIDKMFAINDLVEGFPQVSNVILLVDKIEIDPEVPTSLKFYLSVFTGDIRTRIFKGNIRDTDEADIRKAAVENEGLNPVKVIFTATGLIEESAQEELQRIVDETFIPREANTAFSQPLKTTAAEAKQDITSISVFNRYYTARYLGEGNFYDYVSSEIDPREPNILKVRLVITGAPGTQPIDHVAKIIFPA